jgi:hypothetical protein
MENRTPRYRDLLQAAFTLGRADGLVAAEFEPAGSPGSGGGTCQGRDPEAFARLLWDDQPGSPPSGLVVNAPRWYARGFAEGLADDRHRTADRSRVTPRGRG